MRPARALIDLEALRHNYRLARELTGGRAAGVNSTPTFFLNGKSITITSYEQFKQLVNSAATQ